MRNRPDRWLASLRRAIIFVIGSTVLLIGILLLVLPGPGIVVILLGLALLATEFAWARVMLARAREHAGRIKQKFSDSR